MSECSLLRYLYLAYFSQPTSERLLFRTLRKAKCRAIVEVGIGNGARSRRTLEVARRYRQGEVIRYAGIDLFESRLADAPGLKLKAAYQSLQATGVKIQLAPGDPLSALAPSRIRYATRIS